MTNPLLAAAGPLNQLNAQLEALRNPASPIGAMLRVAKIHVEGVTLSMETRGTLTAECHRSGSLLWYGCTVTISPDRVTSKEHVSGSHGGPREAGHELLMECFRVIASGIAKLQDAHDHPCRADA